MPLAANCSAARHAGDQGRHRAGQLSRLRFRDPRANHLGQKQLRDRPAAITTVSTSRIGTCIIYGLVNGINGRLASLLEGLERATPDIVCLQELKAPDEKFPAAAVRAAGYGAIWRGQKSWNGVAILARGANPTETRRGLPGHPRHIPAIANEAGRHAGKAVVLTVNRPGHETTVADLPRRQPGALVNWDASVDPADGLLLTPAYMPRAAALRLRRHRRTGTATHPH